MRPARNSSRSALKSSANLQTTRHFSGHSGSPRSGLFYLYSIFSLGQPKATALENAVAYVRFTMYDVRFINNVRVAQILFGSLTYAEIPLDPSL